jgi:hypothetical protein
MMEQGKRRFQDAAGLEWWAYETRSDPPIDGAERILTFFAPATQRRERLPWPDGLDGLGTLTTAQLCALLPIAEELPESMPRRWDGDGAAQPHR